MLNTARLLRRHYSVPPPRDAWSGWLREEASNAAEIAIAWGRTAAAVVQLGCTIYVARLYVVDATLCVGPSMDPTCEPYVNALLPARSPLPSLSLTHALLSLSLLLFPQPWARFHYGPLHKAVAASAARGGRNLPLADGPRQDGVQARHRGGSGLHRGARQVGRTEDVQCPRGPRLARGRQPVELDGLADVRRGAGGAYH